MGGGDWAPSWTDRRRERRQRSQLEGVNKGKEMMKMSGGNNLSPKTLFIDGLDDLVSYNQIKESFSIYGRLLGVYVQRRRKLHRQFKFGFVKFAHAVDASVAKEGMNKKKIQGKTILVTNAKFPLKVRSTPSSRPLGDEMKANVRQKKVWKPVGPVCVAANQELCYFPCQEDHKWVRRLVIASLRGRQSLIMLHKALLEKGFTTKVHPMGVKEVALEFDTEDELQGFMASKGESLGDIFETISLASPNVVPTRHFLWLKLWNVPLIAWNLKFFAGVAQTMGTFVCLDDETRDRSRLDYARMRIESPVPYFTNRFLEAKIDHVTTRIWVERDFGGGDSQDEGEDDSLNSGSALRPSSACSGTVVSESEENESAGEREAVSAVGVGPEEISSIEALPVVRSPLWEAAVPAVSVTFLNPSSSGNVFNLSSGMEKVTPFPCRAKVLLSGYEGCPLLNVLLSGIPNILPVFFDWTKIFKLFPQGVKSTHVIQHRQKLLLREFVVPTPSHSSECGSFDLGRLGPVLNPSQLNPISLVIDLSPYQLISCHEASLGSGPSHVTNTWVPENLEANAVVFSPPIFDQSSREAGSSCPNVDVLPKSFLKRNLVKIPSAPKRNQIKKASKKSKSSSCRALVFSPLDPASSGATVVEPGSLSVLQDPILSPTEIKARRAFSVGTAVGVVFNCSEQEAIERFSKQIRSRRSGN